jgi:hypothetical protein
MSPSCHARIHGRVVVDHHDVLYLIRHHHLQVAPHADALVVFVLDAQHRLLLTFVITGFPRNQLHAIEQVNEQLAAMMEIEDATALVVCWCTDELVTHEAADDQLELLAGLRLGALFAGLQLRDIYWIHRFGFVSMADRADAWQSEQ